MHEAASACTVMVWVRAAAQGIMRRVFAVQGRRHACARLTGCSALAGTAGIGAPVVKHDGSRVSSRCSAPTASAAPPVAPAAPASAVGAVSSRHRHGMPARSCSLTTARCATAG